MGAAVRTISAARMAAPAPCPRTETAPAVTLSCLQCSFGQPHQLVGQVLALLEALENLTKEGGPEVCLR